MKSKTFDGFDFYVLEPTESRERAMPCYGRVFQLDVAGSLNDYEILSLGQPLNIFRDPTWQTVALVDEPFFSEDEEAFSGEPDFYPDLYGRDHLAPLLRLLQERGTPHIYLTCSGAPDQSEIMLIPPQRPDLNAAWLSNTLHSMLCSFAVDDRADWGLVIDDNKMYLGGESTLMERFVSESGGKDELSRIFSLYIDGEVIPGESAYQPGDARFYRCLYTYCGWDWPFPEPPPMPTPGT